MTTAAKVQKVATCLWFDGNAEQAVNLYVSLFDDARVVATTHYPPDAPMPEGTVMTIEFELAGTRFVALNGGPHFKFSEASSMFVTCKSQHEIDHFWTGLLAGGGKELACGWITDSFGLSWQIVPEVFTERLQSSDRQKVQRMFAAMLGMGKLDIMQLEAAYNGS